MRGGIRGRIPLVRRTHILDDEMTPHSIDRGLAGSSKQRRRDDFDLKGRSREHLVGAGITVWYQEASARNSSVHELVTTRTQISLQCSFKHAWCVYSPPPLKQGQRIFLEFLKSLETHEMPKKFIEFTEFTLVVYRLLYRIEGAVRPCFTGLY